MINKEELTNKINGKFSSLKHRRISSLNGPVLEEEKRGGVDSGFKLATIDDDRSKSNNAGRSTE